MAIGSAWLFDRRWPASAEIRNGRTCRVLLIEDAPNKGYTISVKTLLDPRTVRSLVVTIRLRYRAVQNSVPFSEILGFAESPVKIRPNSPKWPIFVVLTSNQSVKDRVNM